MIKRVAVLVADNEPPGGSGPLKYAVKDMEDLALHLLSAAGGFYETDEIWLLKNEQATLHNLHQVLATIPNSCDYLLFGFSGHGNSQGIALRDRVLWHQDLAAYLRFCRAERTLVLADCCGAAGFLKRAAALEGFDRRNIRALHAQAVYQSAPGMRALLSCEATENSREGLTRENGEFMGALLSACQQELGDHRDIITAEAAFEFARLYMQAAGIPQTPRSWGLLRGFPLAFDPRFLASLAA